MSIFNRITEQTYEEQAQLGRQAKDILSTDAWYKALEEAELNLLEKMTYLESADEREAARYVLIALDEVVKELRKIQSEGEYADKVIETREE